MTKPPHSVAQSFRGGSRGKRAKVDDPPPPETFGVVLWDNLQTIHQTDRLVKGIIGEGSTSVVVGPPGCGKSFMTLDLGLHVAFDMPWFEHSIGKPGGVLYIAAEGQRGIAKRIAAFRSIHPVGDAFPPPFAVIPAPVDLVSDTAGGRQIAGAVRYMEEKCGRAVVLVVIDTLARCFGGGNENAPEDMNKFLSSIDFIRAETAAAVLVVHHAGKDASKGMRGHSALLGAADTVIEVTGLDGIRTGRLVKQKDGETGLSISFRLDAVVVDRDDDGAPITSCVVVPAVTATPRAARPAAKLPPEYQEALAQLREAVAEHGAPRVAPGVPDWAMVVTIEAWRERLMRKGLLEQNNPARSWFHRMKSRLLAVGLVAELDGYVWMVKP